MSTELLLVAMCTVGLIERLRRPGVGRDPDDILSLKFVQLYLKYGMGIAGSRPAPGRQIRIIRKFFYTYRPFF